MTKSIYQLHDAHFEHVAAYALIKSGRHIGNVSFKFPKDGANRLWCYVHFHRDEMARGCASGYGYDKKSAAFEAALDNINVKDLATIKTVARVKKTAKKEGGQDWRFWLTANKITVLNVV